MAITYVEIEDKYQIQTTDEDVVVSVEIGDGQRAGFLVFLGQELKGSNIPANLGKAKKVANKWTIVSSTIVDKMKETNWTSLTITISEGEKTTTFGPYRKEVQEHLDTVIYIIKIYNLL